MTVDDWFDSYAAGDFIKGVSVDTPSGLEPATTAVTAVVAADPAPACRIREHLTDSAEDGSTPDERAVSAWAQGYAAALGNAALAAGREADRCYWFGYADGVEDGVGVLGARHRSDPRRGWSRPGRERSLTRPGGRR